MPYVTCPTCSERGKIPPNLVGARIKCRKCGNSFMVAAPAGKALAGTGVPAAASAGSIPSAVAEPIGGIEVEGLDASAWVVPTETISILKGDGVAGAEPAVRAEAGPAFVAAEPGQAAAREYKVLTPKDKIFDGKFDLARLEEALNHYARQGWTVKAMSIPHIKNFAGVFEETLTVLLERG